MPLVRVEQSSCADGRTTLTLSQGEFTADRPDKVPLRWQVPVIAAVAGPEAGQTFEPVRSLIDGRGTLSLPGCGPVIVNAGQTGYYRTLYAPAAFAAAREHFARLPAIDQLGLMSDTWSLGLAGLQPASDVLDLVVATPLDADTQVWARVAGALETIDDYYKDDPARRQRFRAFAIPRLAPLMARVGWEARTGEPDTVAILRGKLIGTLAALGDQAVIAEARRRYQARDRVPDAVPTALRKTILGIVAVNADAADWHALRAAAHGEKSAQVKDQLYYLLASAQDPLLAQRALDLALSDEPGATNTAKMIYAVSNRFPELAFDFALANMAAVDERVDATSRSVYYPGLAGWSGNAAMIGKVKAYAEAHLDKGSRRAAETAMVNIRNRIKVRDEQLPVLDAWLLQHARAAAR